MRTTWLCLLLLAGCAPGLRETRLAAAIDPAERVILGALGSSDGAIRLRAIEIAADLADPRIDPALPARLADRDGRVRAVAAIALAGQSAVAAAVLDRALADPDPAARALALSGIASAADPAGALARSAADADPSVRAAAASALARFTPHGGGALANRLLAALARDRDAGVRASALRSLGARGSRSALPEVERALSDPALAPRLAALWSLARIDAGSPRLLALASAAPAAPLYRFVALRASVELHRLGRSDALEAVRAACADPRADVREAAMNAAGELGDAGAGLATPLLRDPSLAVRLAAARALAHRGHVEEARPIFLSALDTPLSLDAADELARLGDLRGRVALEAAASAHDPAVRRRAVALLALQTGSEPILTRALADPDAEVRLTAAATLLRHALPHSPR